MILNHWVPASVLASRVALPPPSMESCAGITQAKSLDKSLNNFLRAFALNTPQLKKTSILTKLITRGLGAGKHLQ